MDSILSLIIVIGLVVISNVRKTKKESDNSVNNKTTLPSRGMNRTSSAPEVPGMNRTSSAPESFGRNLTSLSSRIFGKDKTATTNKKSIPSHLENRGRTVISSHPGERGMGRISSSEGVQVKRTIALRLIEGEPVPQGYNAYRCSYCGAISLVKKGARGKHSCYFCHDPID
jgi:hypothetical protein